MTPIRKYRILLAKISCWLAYLRMQMANIFRCLVLERIQPPLKEAMRVWLHVFLKVLHNPD